MPEHTHMQRAVLFPGQGSQEKGMGRDLAEQDAQIMDLWKQAEKEAGAPLREIFWDGDEATMAQTRYQQPALVVVGLGLWRHLAPSLRPAFVAGHSVGEFTALTAAGVLDPNQALSLVSLRGRLMFEAGQDRAGSMAAVMKLEQERVESIVQEVCAQTGEDLCVANFNSPQQLVLSGAEQALDTAMQRVREEKGRPMPLPVSGAFHSPLMNEAATELSRVMQDMTWHTPQIPVHMNVSAQAAHDTQSILQAMSRQMISPVRWCQLIWDQWDKGVRSWWELGPKGVLSRLMRHILAEKDQEWQSELVSTAEQVAEVRQRLG